MDFFPLEDLIAQKKFFLNREFIGPQWLNYLHQEGIYFVFRLRDNMRLGEIEVGSKKNASCAVMPHRLNSMASAVYRYG